MTPDQIAKLQSAAETFVEIDIDDALISARVALSEKSEDWAASGEDWPEFDNADALMVALQGVNLLAIPELLSTLREKEEENAELKAENERLRTRLAEAEKVIGKIKEDAEQTFRGDHVACYACRDVFIAAQAFIGEE